MNIISAEQLIKNPSNHYAAHVVILGAGASLAAFLTGDKNGKKVPLMNDLPFILGSSWDKLVKLASVPNGDFEFQFSWLRTNSKYTEEIESIKQTIEDYFSSYELPNTTTIYDYLVLGMRGKDLIASFNWDPFLMAAHRRNREIVELPDIRFLHGSVMYSTCIDHDIIGISTEICPYCEKKLIKGGLFFPDYEKDYSKDKIIFRDWMRVTNAIESAMHLTMFGYSCPKTDFMARKLLLESWKKSPSFRSNYLEVIDIKSEIEIFENWKDFFPHGHSIVCKSFWDSMIYHYPRRMSEVKYNASFMGIPSRELFPPKIENLIELQKWYAEIASYEKVDNHNPKVKVLK